MFIFHLHFKKNCTCLQLPRGQKKKARDKNFFFLGFQHFGGLLLSSQVHLGENPHSPNGRTYQEVNYSNVKVFYQRLILFGSNLSIQLSNYNRKGKFHCVDNFIIFQMVITWLFFCRQIYWWRLTDVKKSHKPHHRTKNKNDLSTYSSSVAIFVMYKTFFQMQNMKPDPHLPNWSCICVFFSFGCSSYQQPPASNFRSVCSYRCFCSYYYFFYVCKILT